jgi:RNA polymerase sigma-70 factor (ECF subfamily)
MDEVPQTTRLTLLIRLRDGQDNQAWSDFVEVYSPVVYGFARRQGLQDADAADLVQEVLRSVARSIPNYDHEKGRFRSWLMGVVRNRLREFWVHHGREAAGSGDTRVLRLMEQFPSQEDAEHVWEQEYQQSVFRMAVARIRDKFEDSTWQAFWRTNIEGKSTQEVAQSLGMSEGAVYIAKSRVLARLKKQVQVFQD